MAIPSILLSAQGFISNSELMQTYSVVNVNAAETPQNVTFQALDADYYASLYGYVWFVGDYAYTLQLANSEATFRLYKSRIGDAAMEVILHSGRSGTLVASVHSGGWLFGDNGGFRLLTSGGSLIPLSFSAGTLMCAAMRGSDQIKFLMQVSGKYVTTAWLSLGDLASTIPVPAPTPANAYSYIDNIPAVFLYEEPGDLALNAMSLNEYPGLPVFCNTTDGPVACNMAFTPDPALRVTSYSFSLEPDGDGYGRLWVSNMGSTSSVRPGAGSTISPTAIYVPPATTLKYFWTDANKAVEDPATVPL
ncbi:hypothetical protein [Pseudomonas sp. PI1]|uniref:hypothetical protein n=1 Tax=Pseudomonas sp. PI1 TaxID=1582493 RepID=UPI0005B9DA93|nr:hypothetical protein [Pseudomonas sp. PI1]KWR85525.1 hypothetical protein RN02_02395 [Pseudomonas sp. PI1]